MQELFEWMEYIEDTRQQTKVRHINHVSSYILHSSQ